MLIVVLIVVVKAIFTVSNLLRPTKSEREFVGKIQGDLMKSSTHCRGQLTKDTSFLVPALSSNSLVSLCLKLSSQDRKSDWLTLYQISTSDPVSCSQRQGHTSKYVLNLPLMSRVHFSPRWGSWAEQIPQRYLPCYTQGC